MYRYLLKQSPCVFYLFVIRVFILSFGTQCSELVLQEDPAFTTSKAKTKEGIY